MATSHARAVGLAQSSGQADRIDRHHRRTQLGDFAEPDDFRDNSLRRRDTRRLAFKDNVYSLRATHQFTRFLFARARVDYSTLGANVRGQFLFGWTPTPGTSFITGYNDDVNRNGFNPFSEQFEPGLRRNQRTFFIKLSYLFRRSF